MERTFMKIYIAGCGGMLGDAVYKHFSKKHQVLATDIRGVDTWWNYNDVRNYHTQHFTISDFQPQVILNLAAETDLEYCEYHGNETLATNAGGSANLAAIATKFNMMYAYISTAGIFDGKKGNFFGKKESYNEFDEPNPLSLYGKAKYYGELIAQTVPKHLVVRPGWMMGGGPTKDKKFINKLYKQLVAGATEINAVVDKAGTPTYTNDLAKTLEALIEAKQYGLFNCTCKGETNRYEVAVEFIRLMGLEDRIKVNLVDYEFFKKDYFAARPASEVLDCSRLESCGHSRMRGWKESLAEYVKEFPAL